LKVARKKRADAAHIVLNLKTRNPIAVEDFVATFSSIASQYEKFLRESYPDLSSDAKVFVREVRKGSIEIDLIPWAMQGLSAVVNVIEQVQIVEKFVRLYAERLKHLFGDNPAPKKLEDASRSDLKDFMGAVTAIANDPDGRSTIQAVAFEDGKKKVKAAIVFDTAEARTAQRVIEDRRLLIDLIENADHRRVLMTFKQSNVKNIAMGKRTGERVVIEEISPRDLPLIYASELAEQRIKHEVREADDNVYKKGFVVDVNVPVSAGKPAAYRITNLHQVIDLPE